MTKASGETYETIKNALEGVASIPQLDKYQAKYREKDDLSDEQLKALDEVTAGKRRSLIG